MIRFFAVSVKVETTGNIWAGLGNVMDMKDAEAMEERC
jgi:hypothetical protein